MTKINSARSTPELRPLQARQRIDSPSDKSAVSGFDHGVGHSLLVLCDAKAPHGKKWNDFKGLENYLFIVSISLS
jgi:hypothetical protein